MDSNADWNKKEKMSLNDFTKFRDHTFCEENLHLYNPKPFYQEYSASRIFEEDEADDKDLTYIKEMYPNTAQHIMEYVEDECDKMEYEGSMMFDEYPDRWGVREIEERIYAKVRHLDDENNVKQMSAMNYRERHRRPGNETWLNDMVRVMLYDEMYRRRCRYRKCKRRYY